MVIPLKLEGSESVIMKLFGYVVHGFFTFIDFPSGILFWQGVGNREAVWQRRYCCLVGPFLYVLEKPGSRSYKQYHRYKFHFFSQVARNRALHKVK